MSTAERLAERIDAIMKLVDEFGSARLHAEKYPAGKGAQSYVKNVRAEIQRSIGLLATPADGGWQVVMPLTDEQIARIGFETVRETPKWAGGQVGFNQRFARAIERAHGIGLTHPDATKET